MLVSEITQITAHECNICKLTYLVAVFHVMKPNVFVMIV